MTDQPATRPTDTQRQRRGHDFDPPADQAATIPCLCGTEVATGLDNRAAPTSSIRLASPRRE